jgi:hypothetical protein
LLDIFKVVLPSIFKKTRTDIDEASPDNSASLYPTRAINTILSRSPDTIQLAVALSEIKHLPASASYEVARSFSPNRQPRFTFKDKKRVAPRVEELITLLGVDQPTAELYDSVISDEEFEEIKNQKYKGGVTK